MRIDLIARNRFGYRYENMAAKRVIPLLEEQEVAVRTIYFEEGNFIQEIESDPPDQILLFETPPEFASPGDFFGCPTFHWEAKDLDAAAAALGGKYAKVGFLDPTITHPQIAFLPPGVDPMASSGSLRPFDVIMFDALFEESEFLRYMQTHFGKGSDKEAAAIRRYVQRSRVIWDLAEKFSHPLHLLGEHKGRALINRFPKSLSLHSLMGLQSELESFRLIKQSKILITHLVGETLDRWILPAIFSGCLVLTNETAYLRELFEGEEDCFYPRGDWKALEEKVRFYLKFPKLREQLLLKYQALLQPQVSWKRRTCELINIMRGQC